MALQSLLTIFLIVVSWTYTYAAEGAFRPKSLDELKRAVGNCTCSTGRLGAITGMWDPKKTLKSLIIYPKLREDYRQLAETQGAIVYGTLHGLNLDTEHPFVNVKKQSNNYLVAVLHKAFTAHLPITLRPDDIWLTILQGLAIHVNMNMDTLRGSIFKDTSGDGKRALLVRGDTLKIRDRKNDWSHIFGSFTSQIAEQTVNGTMDVLDMGFTTSTPTTVMAGQVTIFEALSYYLNYNTKTNCGIPEVFLKGTPFDWELLRKKVELLRAYDLDWWLEHLEPICDEFVLLSYHLHEREELSQASTKFWSSIYHYESLSGGPKVTGWVNTLFPYLTTEKGQFILNSQIDWNNRTKYNKDREEIKFLRGEYPQQSGTRLKIEQLQSSINEFNTYQTKVPASAGGISPGAFPPGYTTVPMKWSNYGRDVDTQMNAGFLYSAQNPKTFALEPVIGWCVSEGDIILN